MRRFLFGLVFVCHLTRHYSPGVDLADEDRKFMQYLAENGWEGDVGEDAIGDDSSVDEPELEKQ